ncbi:hypothetical protein ACFPPD_06865 [Cohnella suwonensis]|uniref:Uncharacterized protein n=1 Tax=Cohnella suwonensis TaxID=696072 RepID=A0ABW0LV56_9BACL
MRVKILTDLNNGPAKGSVVNVREINNMFFGKYQIIDDGAFLGFRIGALEAVPINELPYKTINEFVTSAHQNAIDKGWYEEPRTFGDATMLMVTEIAEAVEDYRNGRGFTEIWYEGDKPCGIPTELADTVIRIFDFCGHVGIDLEAAIREKMTYNATRPIRHGGKKL